MTWPADAVRKLAKGRAFPAPGSRGASSGGYGLWAHFAPSLNLTPGQSLHLGPAIHRGGDVSVSSSKTFDIVASGAICGQKI